MKLKKCLNSRFAYAHTLCGHEYVSLEDFENGIKSYQSALMVDSRLYNAWYGLGMIYLRQEKFEFSEHHFRMVFRINPLSSVIMSYLGTALHAPKKNNEALEMMERAILADKKNPLPLYQKANILVSMENLDGALAVLEELKEHYWQQHQQMENVEYPLLSSKVWTQGTLQFLLQIQNLESFLAEFSTSFMKITSPRCMAGLSSNTMQTKDMQLMQ